MPDPLLALTIGLFVLAALALFIWPKGGLLGYLQRIGQLSDRVLREDALKHVFEARRNDQMPTLESLAGALQIKTSRAASLIADIQQRELVALKDGKFELTPKGQEYAIRIIRAHRLWERYLSEESGYDEAKWHNLAERFEHQLSPDRVDALFTQLGRPTHDPHGDPIPTASGDIASPIW